MSRETTGVSIKIGLVSNEPEHEHSDVELIYLLEGQLRAIVTDVEYKMKRDDILLINTKKWHYITLDEPSIALRVHISYDMLKKQEKSGYIVFWCNTLLGADDSYDELRELLRSIVRLEVGFGEKNYYRKNELRFALLSFLTEHYLVHLSSKEHTENRNKDQTIEEILEEINEHYESQLSLSEIAEEHYLSVSTLSRLIKKRVGMSFPDYVNRIRMQHAVEELLHTNHTVTEIALESGFSSPSTFNRVFRSIYEMSPTQYRNNLLVNRTVQDKEDGLPESVIQKIREAVQAPQQDSGQEVHEQVLEVSAMDESKVWIAPANRCVNFGAARLLLQSHMQEQIRRTTEDLGITHVRIWNVFSPSLVERKEESGKVLYNFRKLVIALDHLKEIGVCPFLDLSVRPDVATRNGSELVYRNEDGLVFHTLEEWEDALRQLVLHLFRYYGAEEVSEWIFEFGNSSQTVPYYPEADYFHVFEYGYSLLKSYFPNAKVGGSGYIVKGKTEEEELFFSRWKELCVLPDFISILLFPYEEMADEREVYDKHRIIDEHYLGDQLSRFKEHLKQMDFPDRPIYVVEVSSILSTRNYLNDHCYKGTITLRGIQNMYKDAEMICYWVGSDLLSAWSDSEQILFGGNGMITRDGIPKPAYHALRFIRRIGGHVTKSGPGYFLSIRNRHHISILCYNAQKLSYRYLLKEEDQIAVKDLPDMFEAPKEWTLRINIRDLKDDQARFRIREESVNEIYGSVLDIWKNLDYTPVPGKEDIHYLRQICRPRLRIAHMTPKAGCLTLHITLKPHEIRMIDIMS